MIYSLIGTDTLRREKAYKELASLGPISVHIYSEQIAALKPLVEARSLFGERRFLQSSIEPWQRSPFCFRQKN